MIRQLCTHPIILLFLWSCINTSKVISQSMVKEIQTIENNLLPNIKVIGSPDERYNIYDRMKYHNTPGLSVTILKNREIHWTKSYGLKNASEENIINPQTLFQVASSTKPITALGILKLMEQNKIGLDEEVNRYLKDWKVEENEFTKNEKVTIRRILNHTSGLSGHGFDGYSQTEDIPTTIQLLNGEGNSRITSVESIPGDEWRYSGYGYVILQKVKEDVSGLPFHVFMEEEILKPLKMNNSTFQQPLDIRKYKNVSSAHDNDGNVVSGGWNNYPEKGAGGLWSTSEDMARFCIEIQNILAGKEDGILTKKTILMMLTKGLKDWGLGPRIEGVGEELRFTHDGKNEGFFADFMAFAFKGDGVIILTNGNTPGLKNEILKSVSFYYKWNSHNQRVIEKKELSPSLLEKYIGTYDWIERPGYHIEIIINNGVLNFIAPGFPVDHLTPIGNNKFIDLESEVEVEFTMEEGDVKSVNWRGRFNYSKIE